MVWVLVAVILTSIIYITAMILKYTTFMGEVRPLVKKLRDRGPKLDEAVESETRLNNIVLARIEEEKMVQTKLRLSIADSEKELKAAKVREEQLEMAKYKQDFKKSR